MALTTQSVNNSKDKDNTSEYYVAIDSEGKGYLAKKKVIVEEPIIESVKKPTKEITVKKTKRRFKK